MTPDVAWIGHLDSAKAYRAAFAAVRGDDVAPPALAEVERVVRRLAPMPLCEVTLTSITGRSIRGVYVDALLLVDGSGSMRAALRKVERACAEAVATGARIGALGGFTSIVGEQAGIDPTDRFGMPFTTGNTLTAAVVAAQVGAVAEPGAEVVVVGAAGDVGSGICRLLSADGYRLSLVGRRPGPLAEIAAELAGAVPRSWADAAKRADVVVLVASVAAGGITLEGLRDDAIVLDAGHPPNAPPGPRCSTAGRVRFDVPTAGGLAEFTSHNCAPGEHHACMVEGAVLALEDRFEPFSRGRGRIRPDPARQLLALAERHGLRPAPIRAVAARRRPAA